jgi:hypothetical protein
VSHALGLCCVCLRVRVRHSLMSFLPVHPPTHPPPPRAVGASPCPASCLGSVLGVGLEEAVEGMREGGRRLILVDGTQGHGEGRFCLPIETVRSAGADAGWRGAVEGCGGGVERAGGRGGDGEGKERQSCRVDAVSCWPGWFDASGLGLGPGLGPGLD